MVILLKMLRGMIKAITSQAAPWQVGVGACFGLLLGFLPICPLAHGPAPLGLAILFVAIVINCHLGSVFLFLLLGKVVSLALHGPAEALGGALPSLAQASADIPFLNLSLWSHTGYLGLTLIGFVCAPLVGAFMWWFTVWFRAKVRDRLLAQKALVKTGKVAGNAVVFKLLCWFLGF